MAVTFESCGQIHECADRLLSSESSVAIHETVHHPAYLRFNSAMNRFLTAQQEKGLEDDENADAFVKPLSGLRRAYISTPLPMTHLAKAFGVRSVVPFVPNALTSEASELNDAFKELSLESEHPYEDAVSAAVNSFPDGGLIRIVWKGWYQDRTTQFVESRLREYENLSGETNLIEVVTPRAAAGATSVADIQIVLGNIDYLESPPFERYRSISSARSKALHLICLSPHSKVGRLNEYLQCFEDAPVDAEFQFLENEEIDVDAKDTFDTVFPEYSLSGGQGGRFDFYGDEGFVTRFEGPEGSVKTGNRHVIRLRCSSHSRLTKMNEAYECDVEELNLGDVIAIQTKGLRGDELSQAFAADSRYQSHVKLMESWKERWESFDGRPNEWTLNRIKIKGGQIMQSLNQGHLDRWKKVGSMTAPQSNQVFRQLLLLLEYGEQEIEGIISAKSSLDNHHRQAGKSASRGIAGKLKGLSVAGDLNTQHLSMPLTVGESKLEMTIFKIIDIAVELDS